MSKRVANRRAPSKNKAGRNVIRRALRREMKHARRADNLSWFTRAVDKLRSM